MTNLFANSFYVAVISIVIAITVYLIVLAKKDLKPKSSLPADAQRVQALHEQCAGRNTFGVSKRIHGVIENYRVVELIVGAERYGNISEVLKHCVFLTTEEVDQLKAIQAELDELVGEKTQKAAEKNAYASYQTFHYGEVRIYDSGVHRVSGRMHIKLEKQGDGEFAPLVPVMASITTEGSRVEYDLLDDEQNEAFKRDVFSTHRADFHEEVDAIIEMTGFLEHYAQICQKIKRRTQDGELVMIPPTSK